MMYHMTIFISERDKVLFLFDTGIYLTTEIRLAIIAGTVIRDVTVYCSMAPAANFASNFDINTWQPPIINMAMADDKPPMWHNGAVCR